ncbi:MAG: phosphoadenylyl-sulfate reductase [Proteobacteria bacterium]|nr:phosphoadenylyl-sulfate reductase [Pseudomonadota bacterium]
MNSALASRQAPAASEAIDFCDDLASRIVRRDDATAVLRLAITDAFPDGIALVSSFGTESALLLALAAEVDPAVPVVMLDTGKLFPETLAYRDTLVERLGLRDVRVVRPAATQLDGRDPDGALWRDDPDACCALRKTRPLLTALDGFQAWITGRKRFQSATRREVGLFEEDAAGRIKVNPLAFWSEARIAEEFALRELPPHPLEAYGFPSVGCTPCTAPVAAGEHRRAGRWRGQIKTECGIHLSHPAFA